MQNQSTAIWVSHLCCVSSGGGSRSRSRRAATPCPTIPGDGLAWAEQEHSYPETLLSIMGRLCWRGAANDNNNHQHSHRFIWSHRQSPKCDDNNRNPLRASLIFSSWNHKFCCSFWKHSMRIIIRQIRFECCCFVERGWRHGFRELLCCPEPGINGRAPHLSLILPSWLPRPVSEFRSFWFLPHPSWLGPK